MITQAEFERLPAELAEIVNLDRHLGNVTRRPVADFAEFKRLRGLRDEWRKVAHRIWGHSVRTTANGSGGSAAAGAR